MSKPAASPTAPNTAEPVAAKPPAPSRKPAASAARPVKTEATPAKTAAGKVKAKPVAAVKATVSAANTAPSPAKPPAAAKPPRKIAAKEAASKTIKESKHAVKKPKLIRDSFTFPAVEYAQIGALKQRALKAGHEVKKSELLRAGLTALSALSDAELLKTLKAIDRLKPGRPVK